ncbi:MAG: class C sortase [Peptoniphilaceae bacterium]|nr:class C sortase [Peptoniphilaceae bacterium]MDY6085834.1 class C sortase [Peptoniphilaceae bacterium]
MKQAKSQTSHRPSQKKRSNLPFLLIFLFGFLVLMYPLISRLYYRIDATSEVTDFDTAKSALDPEEVSRRMGLARAFNASLVNEIAGDPYTDEQKSAGQQEYARMLEVHEKIGHVQIPKIDVDIPIYAGTSEEVLQKGVGHLEGTSLPIGGNSSHTVLTAHSGLPTARLFTDLNQLKVGDKFYIHNIEGVLAYQVDQILTVEPSNFSDLLVVPGHDYATLLTCTPIMINTHRLLVRGHRVPYVAAVEEKLIADNIAAFQYKYLFYASLIVIVLLLLIIRHLRKKKRRVEREMAALKSGDAVTGTLPDGPVDDAGGPERVERGGCEDGDA